MAKVTKDFKENFDTWAAHRIAIGGWTAADIEDLKSLLRIDFDPGPDQTRAGLTVIIAAGVEVPAAIDDHEERYRLWDEYFASEAESIRFAQRAAA